MDVVALVSSAGGLDATAQVLAGLGPGLPACVLVLQHMPPSHDSRLEEVLQRVTPLPVSKAVDAEPLEAGRVLIAPAGCHTLVTPDRHVSLIVSGRYPPSRPSADLLLTTLAMAVGRGAIAVVLSGAGHDAATGATAVHKHGGIVLTTDEETSAHFSMPAATIERDSITNASMPVHELAAHLAELVTL